MRSICIYLYTDIYLASQSITRRLNVNNYTIVILLYLLLYYGMFTIYTCSIICVLSAFVYVVAEYNFSIYRPNFIIILIVKFKRTETSQLLISSDVVSSMF